LDPDLGTIWTPINNESIKCEGFWVITIRGGYPEIQVFFHEYTYWVYLVHHTKHEHSYQVGIISLDAEARAGPSMAGSGEAPRSR